ncbi:hypothetical protein C8R43DRAFT_1128240 [Mycena crocata]|nr:hypothetical protein C8R43DRAFT_1128240 [Mycena crocata]
MSAATTTATAGTDINSDGRGTSPGLPLPPIRPTGLLPPPPRCLRPPPRSSLAAAGGGDNLVDGQCHSRVPTLTSPDTDNVGLVAADVALNINSK